MLIILNGKEQQCEKEICIADLIAILKLEGRLAVEVNLEIVPRSAYAQTRLHEGDQVEIVRAIGGG